MTHVANAEPEKRLFIELLTRDISLVDAVLDLIDNSINSAIRSSKKRFASAADYMGLLDIASSKNLPSIDITVSDKEFKVTDTCGGISIADAENSVFKFGRTAQRNSKAKAEDTLSVYGIGLKRAIFKIGNVVRMESAHPGGGFGLKLNVKNWEGTPQARWSFPITEFHGKRSGSYGTMISVTSLYDNIKKRVADGTLSSELVRRIGRTYCYFLDRIVTITINGKAIPAIDIKFGSNTASDHFKAGRVSCAILAGISAIEGKFYSGENAGWFIFCNGRAIAFAEKTELTGWGSFLPSFQPKHRPFSGLVFFTSEDAEDLPWTTTKSAINQESEVWQHALRVMGTVGKQITAFLDSRYTNDGTEISIDELAKASGKPGSALRAVSASTTRNFEAPSAKPETTSIQFSVKIKEVSEVKKYLGRRTASNGEVGRVAFDYYLKNVVRE